MVGCAAAAGDDGAVEGVKLGELFEDGMDSYSYPYCHVYFALNPGAATPCLHARQACNMLGHLAT